MMMQLKLSAIYVLLSFQEEGLVRRHPPLHFLIIRTKHTVEYDKHFLTKKTSYSANDDVDDPDTSSRKRFLSQPTLASVLEKKKLWDINHPKSVELHHAIAQMIAVDNQPYSFVEDEGFRNMMSKAQPQYKIPSREYFKDKVLPKMYSECRADIASLISSSENISLTTDMWTNTVTKDSFISFTAHWIDIAYNYRHAVLHARHFPGSHTGERISTMLSEMSAEWAITNKIHLVIRDSGENIVKGIKDANLKSKSCFLHNLHLIVTDALNSQRAVKEIVAIGRKIVGHFNHSSLACSIFKHFKCT
ncbi:hypothetical protein JTE90_024387 [Oedothorax gibbosus]|uniref:Transposase n=1 Tax=Oedothorax gibbosus TaxID=931172 RepID=A0AAV6TTB9_9ARAC|nr:hypothetical protein JTE90_024387 [Oedothorax gibbosus]